jgi:hypothetical protein
MKKKITSSRAKIHTKAFIECISCFEEIEKGKEFIFHKTLRQTHMLCLDCSVGFLRSHIDDAIKNLRKNIPVCDIQCPGNHKSDINNKCCKKLQFSSLNPPESHPLKAEIQRINFFSNLEFVLCPTEDCFEPNPTVDKNNKKITHITCAGCNVEWCIKCNTMPYHHNLSCTEWGLSQGDTELGKFLSEKIKNGDMKLCPCCKTPTEKERFVDGKFTGCNKMTCEVCHSKWCWLCEMNNIDYDHFRESSTNRCGNKLWEGTRTEQLAYY